MKYRIAALIALGTLYGLPVKAAPISEAGNLSSLSTKGDAVQKVEYREHSRWRSHHRWGWRSGWYHHGDWHRRRDWDRDRYHHRDRDRY
jgi:hypothetical protein